MTTVVATVALLLSVAGGWFVVSGVLKAAARSHDSGGADDSGEVGPHEAAGAPDRHELRGGSWIGALERLAITGTVLLGHPEGVAVVVAVKGLGRYPEISRNPTVSERFVIGSLASLVWSVGLGAAARGLIG